MSTVYIVTSGSYDDYRIEAIFSTHKLAEKAALQIEDGDVEEHEVLDHVPPPVTWHSKRCVRGKVDTESRTRPGWSPCPMYGVGIEANGVHLLEWTLGPDDGRCYRFWGQDRERVHAAFDAYHARNETKVQ